MTRPAAAKLEQDLAAAGFLLLGGFAPDGTDSVPLLSGGKEPRSLFLIGSTGPSIWPHLTASPEYRSGQPDPLDRYTRRCLHDLAETYGYEAAFPFDGPPYFPFQAWALACGGFSQSPLGVLVHEDFGPWAGFRAAFLSPEPLPPETGPSASNGKNGPCTACRDKPCLSVCPVSAISEQNGYDVAACQAHLHSTPEAACWSGCGARHACPFGTGHKPASANARFHMESFAKF